MRLANGIVAFEFDPHTGSLIQIQDLRSGVAYLSGPGEGRLFRLFVPDDENWIDRYADSHVSGSPQMELSGDSLSIRYPELHFADGSQSGIEAIVRVRLPPGDDEALFTIELINHGPHLICEVLFPWVGGWHGYPADRGVIQCGTRAPFDPFTGLRRNDGWNLLNGTRRVSLGFPHVNLPLCAVHNNHLGLSYNFYPLVRDLNFDLFVMDLNEAYGDPHPSFAWVQRPFLPGGGAWQGGPVGIAPFQGDWHAAADKLRRWLETWWKPPILPASLRGAIGLHNAYFRDFTGRQYRPLSALPKITRYGLEHGLSHFILWDMPLLGMYLSAGQRRLFEDDADRRAELVRVLRTAQAPGVTVSPLINLRLTTQTHPFWREHGERWAIRSRYGIPAAETLPLRRNTAALITRYLDQGGAKLCQRHPEFQEWALGNVGRVLDLGFKAVFIDQPFSEDYCFSPGHPHPPGASGHEGACSWVERAARLVHRHDPQAYLIGEVPDIWNTQYCELWWFWDWSWLDPEVFRYVLPQSLQSWVIDAVDHGDQVGKAFALGFLLNINVRSLEKSLLDAPEFAARVAQLASLRRRTAACTWLGRFMGGSGMTLDTDAEVAAALYDAGDRLGVALGEGSRTERGGGKVKLSLDSQALAEGGLASATLHRQDGSSQPLKLRRSGGNLVVEADLGRWESAVVELDKPQA